MLGNYKEVNKNLFKLKVDEKANIRRKTNKGKSVYVRNSKRRPLVGPHLNPKLVIGSRVEVRKNSLYTKIDDSLSSDSDFEKVGIVWLKTLKWECFMVQTRKETLSPNYNNRALVPYENECEAERKFSRTKEDTFKAMSNLDSFCDDSEKGSGGPPSPHKNKGVGSKGGGTHSSNSLTRQRRTKQATKTELKTNLYIVPVNDSRMVQTEQTVTRAPKTWILKVEITKVVEEGVSHGYYFRAKNSERTLNEIKNGRECISDGNDMIDSSWCFEVEIAKVLEIGAALDFYFRGNEIEV
ncbi:hypothetical protein LWI28_025985 [Acer negundo]|uniref:Uncharacterized protein n=1 Tax=Acer negundo TaxID=4023 RepID=A0AAD5IG78_ACENE|nr:hypothetical protein LWI28_025985 [Acer negundo]